MLAHELWQAQPDVWRVLSLIAPKPEPSRDMKLGTRVKVVRGMSEFVGSTGVVVDVDKRSGAETMYRVRLDRAVKVEHVGMVTDDLWAKDYLQKVR